MHSLFSRYGAVHAVKCFRSKMQSQRQGATTGCGLVKMGTVEEAEAAIKHLHMSFVWLPILGPMVRCWHHLGGGIHAVACTVSAARLIN